MKLIDKYLKNYSSGFRDISIRTLIFIISFIAISYIIGQKIVGSSLLYGFGIYIYGGMGYLLLFCILGFFMLNREKLFKLKKQERNVRDYILLIVSMILLACFYFVELNIENLPITLLNQIMVHLVFVSLFVSLVLSIIGVNYVVLLVKKFKKELFYFLIFFIISYSLMTYVWKLWPYLSYAVSKAVYFLLSLISNDVRFRGSDILIFEGFGAKIGEACSGIYSIFIFSGLFAFILFMDWYKLNKKRALLLFIPAVIGAFIVNIFRVFLLMIVGAYMSKEAALGLYHSYTGMIFFMIYFVIFWLVAYKWIKKKD